MNAASQPTVFVVDDDPAVRDSLKQLLSLARLSVETYASATEFLESHRSTRPACLVLDVRMPGLSGPDLHAQLLAKSVDMPVIIITGHGDISMASRSFRMGVEDFIEKPFDAEELLQRIRSALDKDARAMCEEEAMAEITRRVESLTEPERQVMDLLIEGHLNKNIASRLDIAERTVEDRRARILAKMKLGSIAELARTIERLQAWNSRTRINGTSQ